MTFEDAKHKICLATQVCMFKNMHKNKTNGYIIHESAHFHLDMVLHPRYCVCIRVVSMLYLWIIICFLISFMHGFASRNHLKKPWIPLKRPRPTPDMRCKIIVYITCCPPI